jgi:hypothetical protein
MAREKKGQRMMNETVVKGRELKQRGIIVCGSSVAIFGPVLAMMSRRGNTNPVILYVLFACWVFDLVLGVWFIVRGNKLIQQGSESNG